MWYDNEGIFYQLYYGVFPWVGHVFGYIYAFARCKFGIFIDWLIGKYIFGTYGNSIPVGTYYLNFSYVNPFASHYVDGVLTYTYDVSIKSPLEYLNQIPGINLVSFPVSLMIEYLFKLFDWVGLGWLYDMPAWSGVIFFAIFFMLFLKFTNFVFSFFNNFAGSALRNFFR